MKCFYKKIQERPIIFLTVLNTIWMIIVLTAFEVTFDNTDDHLMRVLLDGGKGKATSEIIFINIVLSKIIYLLSNIFPVVNWLGVIEEGIILISFISISYVAYKLTKSYIIAFLLSIFFSGYWYTTLTFSAVAMIGGISSCVLLLYALKEQKTPVKCVFAGVLLLSVSVWLREMAILGTVPFIGALVIENWKKSDRKRKFFIKIILFGSIPLSIIIGSKHLNNNYYKNCNWYSEYNETNKARASVIDYKMKEYEEVSSELSEIGVTKNDYGLIQARIFDDYSFFDNKTLNEISLIAGTQTNFEDKCRELVGNYWVIMGRPFFYVILWYSIISIIVFFKKRNYILKIIYIWLVLHLYTVYLYCMVGRFPIYVQDGIYFSALIMMIYSLISELTWRKRDYELSFRRKVACLFIVTVIFFGINDSWILNRTSDNQYKIPAAQKFVKEISQRENEFYFMDFLDECARIYSRSVGAFENIEQGRYANIERLSSWDKALPVTNLQFENYGIKSPLQDLLKEGIYLISNSNGHMELIRQYYKEHMNKEVFYYVVEEHPEIGVNIYKFQEVELDVSVHNN